QNVVSYTTMIDVPNPELKLKPGMTAYVTVQIAMNENVLRVPNAALRFSPTPEVFAALGQQAPEGVATTGTARAVPNTTGTAGGAREGAGGNRLAQLTPAERAQFQERLAQMTPEQR